MTKGFVLNTINLWKNPSTACPVEFVYLTSNAKDGNRRWIDGLVRCRKGSTNNLHNHPLHGATKIAGYTKSKITDVHINSSLTASDINDKDARMIINDKLQKYRKLGRPYTYVVSW